MSELITTNKYKFLEEGFQTELTKQVIPYEQIISVKKDVSSSEYKIKYKNSKNKNRNETIDAISTQVEDIDEILKHKIPRVEHTNRNRTFLEAGASWFSLFFVVAFIAVITVMVMNTEGRLRMPVIIIPFVVMGLKLGITNIVAITVGSAVVSVLGTLFSFTKKKKIELFVNKNLL